MDARKSPSALFEIRKQVVRLHKKGIGPMAIKEQTGISWGAIRKAIDLFEAGGMGALNARTAMSRSASSDARSLVRMTAPRVRARAKDGSLSEPRLSSPLFSYGCRGIFSFPLPFSCDPQTAMGRLWITHPCSSDFPFFGS